LQKLSLDKVVGMTWTTFDEIKFREGLPLEAVAKLEPMPERLAKLLAERRPYTGPERRSPYRLASRAAVEAAATS
jgi:hypothetical protein